MDPPFPLRAAQEAVNSKGGLAALSAVDKVLRSLGKEMVQLGHPPMGGGQAGLLHGTSIGEPGGAPVAAHRRLNAACAVLFLARA